MFQPNDIVCVLIPNAVNNGYDYRLTVPAPVGAFVRVSVRNQPFIGVIVGPGTSGLPPTKIKPVEKVFMLQDFGMVLDHSPLGGSRRAGEASDAVGGVVYDIGLSESTLKWLYKMSEWTMMPPGAVLRLILNIPDAFAPPKMEPLFAYKQPDEKGALGNRAPPKKIRMTDARQSVADAFASNDFEPMSANDIQNIARVSPTVVRTMVKNEILEFVGEKISNQKSEIINYFDTGNVVLNDEQKAAADQISVLSSQFSVHVLDGITGSGKTQVYFDAALKVYGAGRCVLLMMPEIALTAQFKQRFADRFGAPPVVWHSNLTSAKRRDIWRGVASGQIRIVVGTRSALFLPWRDLGLVVVDEEHDASYKQEDMGNYHARDMAILRGSIENFPVILASATPSAETIKKINDGAYKSSRLTARFGGAIMPTIELIDMRKERPEKY